MADVSDLEEEAEYVREACEVTVLPGLWTRPEVDDWMTEFVTDVEIPRDQAWTILNDVWARRVAEESGWEGEGDWAKLERAFRALEADRVCTESASGSQLDTVIGFQESAAARTHRGYVFWTLDGIGQAAEEPGDLPLYFAAFATDEQRAAESEKLAPLIMRRLEEHGLTPEWSGDAYGAIHLVDLRWRKPLPD